MKSFSESYKEAGVDVTAGYKAVELMKAHVAKTMTSGVLSGIGGFGGLFELDMTGISKPVLVSGTDGVGTKLKIAFLMDKHNTVGIDDGGIFVQQLRLGRAVLRGAVGDGRKARQREYARPPGGRHDLRREHGL